MFIICSAPLHPHMQGSALPCKEAVRAHDPETLLDQSSFQMDSGKVENCSE